MKAHHWTALLGALELVLTLYVRFVGAPRVFNSPHPANLALQYAGPALAASLVGWLLLATSLRALLSERGTPRLAGLVGLMLWLVVTVANVSVDASEHRRRLALIEKERSRLQQTESPAANPYRTEGHPR
ncbi:MAG TPA: hypothetical protein VGN26_15185 [Armatimonadota bacterium]